MAAAPVADPDAGTGPDVVEITGMDSAEVGRLAAAHGILTLHFPPRRVTTDAPGIVSELQSAIDKGLARPRLPITAVPQAA